MGNVNPDVKELQKFLNSNGFFLSRSGIGSFGQETNFFGSATKNALIKFQKANKIIPAFGYFGQITRKAVNKLNSSSTIDSNFLEYQPNNNQPINNNVNSNNYYIKGSITGIIGPVVLQNNGQDDLIIDIGNSSNFTFPTTIANGSSYYVTAKPKYFGQTCYTANNIGIVNGVNIENIKIACGANLSHNPFTSSFIGRGSSRVVTPTINAPSGLSYNSPNLFVVGTTISTLLPTISESVTSYSISPDLPAGLSLNTSNGEITGTPTTSTTQSTYTITASNAGGSTTFGMVMMVDDTVVGANGKIWLDRNLGATQVATSSTDYLAYGDLYQWGRPADGHQAITWTSVSTGTVTNGTQSSQATNVTPGTNTFIISGPDWSSIDSNGAIRQANWGANGTDNPCPIGFRIPTEAELTTERLSWGSNNLAGAFGSTLKLPAAGGHDYGNNSIFNVTTNGYYWSNSVDSNLTRYFYFSSGDAAMSSIARAYGLSIRCTANSYAIAFNANGSTGGTVPANLTKTHDVTLVLATNSGNLVKTGYTFSGWNTSADGAGTDYTVGGNYTANASVTLYAKWTINTYTVTFNINEGDGGSTATQTLNYNTPTALRTNGFTKTGYTFTGWATTAAGAVAYTNGASYTIGTENITLYAKWTPTLAVGTSYQGGIIAYILQAGDPGYVAGETHGLIAATANQSTGIIWAKVANQSTAVTGGTLTAIGSGSANTDKIISQNGLDNTYAAGIARSYAGGGYTDWYLPSQDEITKLYISKDIIGGFTADYYWSSSEGGATSAWSKHFSAASLSNQLKSTPWTYVRAIRSF